MQQLSSLIERATAAVSASYFQVQIDGGDPVYRERVYCYELYHQLRSIWPHDTGFCLNGELDKAAHPILKTMGASYAKPDLLVHTPGSMAGNSAIIEVKASNASSSGIEKDLKTLGLFRSKVGYGRAIYLIFGRDATSTIARIRRHAQSIEELPNIELWIHSVPGHMAMLSSDIGHGLAIGSSASADAELHPAQ